MLYSIAVLTTLLLVVPYLTGLLFTDKHETVLETVVYGYMVNFAVFFVLALYAVLKDRSLSFLTLIYIIPALVLSAAGLVKGIVKKEFVRQTGTVGLSKSEMIYLSCFIGVVLFQIYKTVFYAYADGDDAYYIALSQDMTATGILYRKNPYHGVWDGFVNMRYALAPFSAWLALIAAASHVPVTIVSFIVVPCVLILVTYIIYGMIGKVLFGNYTEKRFVFLLLISVFVMFSNVSTSTAETFLLTRARQGKEGLANIVIPFMFAILAGLIKGWHEGNASDDKKIGFGNYILLLSGALAGGLMSVFGNILVLIMLFIFFLYVLFKEKSIKLGALIAFLAIPNMGITLYYIIRG